MAEKRSEPMPVKYWSAAGLVLTTWCNARCASCYLRCGPARPVKIDVDYFFSVWSDLVKIPPHGCRVHLTGGEPFGDWGGLLALCRRAADAGIGPLQKVETNAFWATDEDVIRRRVKALDAAGMRKLSISCDPYHQQFVPLENVRRLATVAGDLLGPARLQVRWEDWLEHGFDTAALSDGARRELFGEYARQGRDRINGRAVETLAESMHRKSWQEFADECCRESLLRGKHVHVDADGCVTPGTCAGLMLGNARRQPIDEMWRQLYRDHDERPIVGLLSTAGPVGLAICAAELGFQPDRRGYAGKCHLCYDVREFLHAAGRFAAEIGPGWLYAGR
ncbi:MAG: hypothetical protein ACLFV7_01985 [Phycisphaerae bacterium]